MKNLTQAEKGAADDIAAKQVGLSRPTALKGAEVVGAIDRLTAEGKQDEADALRQVLNGQSFDAAIRAAIAAGHIETPPPKTPSDNPKTPTMREDARKPPADARSADAGEQMASESEKDNHASQPPAKPNHGAEGKNTPGDKKEAEGIKLRPTEAAENGLPPIVVLTEAINRFVDDQEDFDASDITADQKWNFNRAFDALANWRDDHAVMLKMPGRVL